MSLLEEEVHLWEKDGVAYCGTRLKSGEHQWTNTFGFHITCEDCREHYQASMPPPGPRTFNWRAAMAYLRQGKELRRKDWLEGDSVQLRQRQIREVRRRSSAVVSDRAVYVPSATDLISDDWYIFTPPEEG